LLNYIVDFSKIESRKIDFETIDFLLRDTLDAALKTVSLRAQQKGLELLCHVLPEVPDALRGDPSRLRQIVVNLVGNAIKFTAAGEVAVRVECPAQTDDSAFLHVSVRDTGVGIPAEKQATIFEAFTQADSSMTRKFGGTGLGLTICTRLVAMMNGRIWVESQPGHGSTFHFDAHFTLQKPAPLGPRPADVEALRGLPVLVVDDNATNRRILDERLCDWGMHLVLAENGLRALTFLQPGGQPGKPFSLLLLDAQMDGMDGFRVAEAIQQDRRLQQPRMILLTSAGIRGDAARCRQLGISAYLPKPVRRSDLLETIVKVLAESPSQPESGPSLVTLHSLRESRGRLKILLAEDNRVNQTVAVRVLEKRGHSVAVAETGKLALETFETQPFDLVLMDVQMPEMDGLEATAAIRLREKATGKHIPIIAMTAHAMVGDRERCMQAGMDGYITKPIRVDQLFAVIADLVPSLDSAPA
jgi:CheY-like chemotaxis protein